MGIHHKTDQFQGKLFTSSFLLAADAGPILDIDFLRKFRITVAPETSQIMFACTVAAQPTTKPSLPNFCQYTAEPPTPPRTTPPLPELLLKGLQLDSFQSNREGNQSIVDPPLSVQPIPDSMPADVKLLLQKFPSILCMGDVVPNSKGGHPLFFP